jgi:tripeptide aminopeptidase
MSAALKSVETDNIRVAVETNREFEGFRFRRDHPAAKLAQNGLMAVGLTPHFRLAGGGSDANVFNAHGVPALVLSVGYNNAHAIQEQVHISDMAASVGYLVEMVRIAATQAAGTDK